MRGCLILIFALLAGAAAAQTPASLSSDYETSWSPPDRRDDAEAVAWFMGGMKFEGNFKIWYLLGEPVVNCTARWTNSTGGYVTLRADDGVRTETAGDGEVEVYNLILAASWPDPLDTSYGVGSAKTIAVPCGAGVVAQNGRKGFNVAGSPSWDKFLCGLPDAGVSLKHADDDLCRAMGGDWLDAVAAKEVARKGLVIANRGGRALGPSERAHNDVAVDVIKGEVSGMAVMKRVEKRLWRETSAAFKLARSKDYFADFPSREGEGAAQRTARRNDAMRRLPHLPSENPSTDQLQAYEAVWQAVIAEHGYGAKLEKDWRKKEKALVAAQLKRLKQRDAGAAEEEESFLRYYAGLQRLKENEPVQPDPMAAYQTATPLVEYEGENRYCGFKDQNGKTVIPAQFADCRIPLEGYGLYRAESWAPNGFGGSVGNCPPLGSPSCNILYDQSGRVVTRADSDSGTNMFVLTPARYGLVQLYASGKGIRFYSIPEDRFLHDYVNAHSYSMYYLRRGRLVVPYYNNQYCDGGDKTFRYFYLDTERFEENGVCTNPKEDPLNEMVE